MGCSPYRVRAAFHDAAHRFEPHVRFRSPNGKLAVEIDGSQHLDASRYDKERTRFLEGLGWERLRFWNSEVCENPDGVAEAIIAAAALRPRRTRPLRHPAGATSPRQGEDQGNVRDPIPVILTKVRIQTRGAASSRLRVWIPDYPG